MLNKLLNKKHINNNTSSDYIAPHDFCNKRDFAENMTKNLYKNIFQDILSKIKGLDNQLTNCFYGNSASPNQYFGLIDLIIKNYTKQKKQYYSVSIESNAIVFEEIALKKYIDTSNILVLDFYHEFEALHVRSMYNTLHNVLNHANNSTNASNKPVLYISQLRADMQKMNQASADMHNNNLKNSLNEVIDALNAENSLIKLDANDRLEMNLINMSSYTDAIAMINNTISNITRLPTSYISGQFAGGLNTTGEGDYKAVERALQGYYNEIIHPVLTRISLILGYDSNFSFEVENMDKYIAIANIISSLEATELLTEEEKRKLIIDKLK